MGEINPYEDGAIVWHTSPFDHLISYKNDFELSKVFIDMWVKDFYMNIGKTDTNWINKLLLVKNEITSEIIQNNLGDFNWRTRRTGAFFSAITNQTQFIDVIGVHLLKSEVCYAGSVYCQALTAFNTTKCVDYLNTYLDFYLNQVDLWFDQSYAMEAILHLDKINNTNCFDKHIDKWNAFIKNKPNWDKTITTNKLEAQLAVIDTVKNYVSNKGNPAAHI
jgi:hypothetical protein